MFLIYNSETLYLCRNESIDEVHSTIVSIIDKYEASYKQRVSADKLNNGLFK